MWTGGVDRCVRTGVCGQGIVDRRDVDRRRCVQGCVDRWVWTGVVDGV